MNFFASLLFSVAVLLAASSPSALFVEAQAAECVVCEFVLQYVEGFLAANYTESQIIAQLDNMCALAPEPFDMECDQFVQKYTVAMINYVINSETPSVVCEQLQLCSYAVTSSLAKAEPQALDDLPTLKVY